MREKCLRMRRLESLDSLENDHESCKEELTEGKKELIRATPAHISSAGKWNAKLPAAICS